MPRNSEIKKILIIGSGPIVIGQACEFDYSGTQACKALMSEGFEVVLVNSNPATIMTDPEIASRTYIEPITAPYLEEIIKKERPDSLIPSLGGQTALNAALELADKGILEKYNVKMLGTSSEIIRKAEDRKIFKEVLDSVGARAPKSFMVNTLKEGLERQKEIGLPIILRPNYTLGGGGGGIAYSLEEFTEMLTNGLIQSPTSEVLIEESILGWKEFELEVMRDARGTFVVICSIENIDPCGVHTGDSITVAPQQTLSDREYQDMRDEASAIIGAIGLETGGANIQFAVHPKTAERVVIEMNPRVSRSSALASKATGFPIAKIAALLAVGYYLEEIQNDITKSTPCCYEPALDYVVTKIPRFAFEKFHGSKDLLTSQMKSVGEVMGIGRTFKESYLKAVRSLEESMDRPSTFLDEKLSYPNSERMQYLFKALNEGVTEEEIYDSTKIDPWFIDQFKQISDLEKEIEKSGPSLDSDLILKAKRFGFSDEHISYFSKSSIKEIENLRLQNSLRPGYFQVDTCAGEFKSETPYFYSSYWTEPQIRENGKNTVVVIGSGANRIGQGIEFDYGCVRGVWALQKQGFNVVMVNSNPETVSTDYDTANELFFGPLEEESIMELLNYLKPVGVVTQWGGQTSLKLARSIADHGYNILGSSMETIDGAEDRAIFGNICNELGINMPKAGMASSYEQSLQIVEKLGYPIMVRPSYVLGGRRMEIIENQSDLQGYFNQYSQWINEKSPVLIDEFLEGALEVDVDLVAGEDWTLVCGITEHIEAAGVHSGDSMGVLPPQRLKETTCKKIESMSCELAKILKVKGHLNLQLAIKDDEIFIIEANPRSSRSVPFVAKATGIPVVQLAVLGILGKPLPQKYDWTTTPNVNVKGVVFPFDKFKEADTILGPEMKSTGESMGRGKDYPEALLKASISSKLTIPNSGKVLLSLRDKDKSQLLGLSKKLIEFGFELMATSGTSAFLNEKDVPCKPVKKVLEGRPHCVDFIRSGEVSLVINTTSGRQAISDSFSIRRSCIDFRIPCITESDAAEAFVLAMEKSRVGQIQVHPLQDQ